MYSPVPVAPSLNSVYTAHHGATSRSKRTDNLNPELYLFAGLTCETDYQGGMTLLRWHDLGIDSVKRSDKTRFSPNIQEGIVAEDGPINISHDTILSPWPA